VGVYADLIYAEMILNFHMGSGGVIIGNASILGKYPFVYEIIKVYPLLGVGIIGGEGGEGSPVILGGRIDVGLSEIAYLRSELLFAFGGYGSTTLFKIGGGFDIGLGESKKVYLRPELLYHLRGAEGEGWWHVFDIHVGIGYKW
jgi:hypothetical protein